MNINLNIRTENPIERLRIKHNKTQKEFALSLKYLSVHNYAYHMNRFSPDIRKRILDVYAVDLTSDIIVHLLYKLNATNAAKVSKDGKISKKAKDSGDPESLLAMIGYPDGSD